ncbi:MAG: hypothetical protein ABEJ31_04515 [Haloarculaceae archaeon]
MSLLDWICDAPASALVLLALAVAFVVLALADVSLGEFDPATLSIVATVFAATAGAQHRRAAC